MTIRDADLSDVPGLVEMGLDFVELTEYRHLLKPTPEKVEQTMRNLIASPLATVLVAEESDGLLAGMFGLMVYEHPFTGKRTAAEMFWFVQPFARGSLGLRLLHAAEVWAAQAGAVLIQMIAPNDKVERIYRARGYTRVEVSYQKRLAS